ncbi:LysR family transcriptional regulator [Rugamonas sp. CCM 8940]|uniref:LysR family transcriptional regulator n=1 Tax=Rugamonas sp. CCM 8940 TaxID=2765359 RepID=UPI0018F77E5D|nr:LysR family transcriptional regulator [Rugamonas sp. CCM 8940]MBJ7311763.1 LysR family transcriptional regulator [Rugamonas sp. CCM 8940]
MDRLQSMRVFSKVVEQGSFARAGSALAMSNAVVTRHVADLEQHLGARLLNRTTRRLSLTETGRHYLERVRSILGDIDDADAIASSAAQRPSGTLRIYCHPGFGRGQLAPLLPRFAAEQPDIVLDVTMSDRNVDLVEDGFDVGIYLGIQKIDPSMVARRLATSSVILCAAPAYLARRGTPATPRELSGHDCLNYAYEELRHHWPMRCGDKEVEVPIVSKLISNNADVLRHAAIAGMGIVMRTSCALDDDLESGRLVRVLPQFYSRRLAIILVYPSRRQLSAKVRSFIDFMVGVFPDPQADPWLPAG